MKKSKSSSAIAIFGESVVFDYVAGRLNEKDTADFEIMMADTPELRKAVDSERKLREALVAIDERDATQVDLVSGNGIEKLFDKLDDLEQEELGRAATSDGSAFPNVFPLFQNRNLFALTAVAASAVFAAVLFVNFQAPEPMSEFVLLSDDSLATQIDFNQLVKEHKVAQVWLSEDLSAERLSKLFSENGLKPISRAGHAWIVSSPEELSTEKITKLEAITLFQKVRLISHNDPLSALDYKAS